MAIDSSNSPKRLAIDVRAAQDLRARFKENPQAGLKEAAQQFESLFLQMVLKSMREATPQDGLFNSDQTRFYTAMLDQQLAQDVAGKSGLGFARLIEEQLGRHLAAAGTAGPASAAGSLPAMPLTMPEGRQAVGPAATSATRPAEPALAALLASAGGESGSAREFVGRTWPHAVEASRSTGIPPQFLVAHAALESGWGKHEIRRADGTSSFNLFGIKAGKSWQGDSVMAQTTEYVDGEAQSVKERFRAYASYAEAFRDYAGLLRNNPRYGAVIGSQDGTEFARRLQQAGYATDPMYADKLARIINGPTLRQALIG